MWDNYWYAGRYELVNYSALYYPLAALVGEAVVVVGSVALATAAFARVALALVGRHGLPAALAFAALYPTVVISGQHPFALGGALALVGLRSLQARRPAVALPASALALLASPLAFLFLAVALAGAAAARRDLLRSRQGRVAVAGIVAFGLAEVLVLRLFPSGGSFPFPPLDLAGMLLFAAAALALARGRPTVRPVAGVAGAFAVAALVLFAFPSGVGGNIARVLDHAALPSLLLIAAERRFRPRLVIVAVLVVATAWQAVPVVRDLRGGLRTRADAAAFWSGAASFLAARNEPDFRVEAVATWGHWESYHLASQDIPIVRGWFRQDDFPANEALYLGDLDAERYRAWLRSLGVRYVVLPDEQLDYSARAEAQILRAPGHGGLRSVYRDATVEIFELPAPTPIVTASPPGSLSAGTAAPRVVRMDRASIVVWLPAPGRYDLRIRYSPYWRATDADAGICIAPAGKSQMTRLYASRPGPVRLVVDVTLGRSANQALGDPAPSCAYPPVGWEAAAADR